MPTDATGTPSTKFGIRKYNTSVDAPSGLGFNGAMDDIDTLLSTLGIASLAANDVPVYDSVAGKFKKASGTHDGTKFLRDDGTWASISTGPVTYRKNTAKAVNTTVAATDLLNAEVTVGAAVLGTTGMLRITAWGDVLQNSGVAVAGPRLQLVFGGTTFIDTNVPAAMANSATRQPWKVVAEIQNAGSASAQTVTFLYHLAGSAAGGFTAGVTAFTTGTGTLQTVMENGTSATMLMGLGVNSGLTVNTANAQAVVLNTINGSASASYETKLYGALIEVI